MAVLLSVCSRLKKAGKTFFRWKPYEGIGGMVATNWSQTLLAKATPTTWLLQWFIMWTSSRQHAAQCWASPGYVVCVSQVLLAFKCRSLYSPPHCFGRYYCMSCKRYCDALPQLACIYKYHAGSWILNIPCNTKSFQKQRELMKVFHISFAECAKVFTRSQDRLQLSCYSL